MKRSLVFVVVLFIALIPGAHTFAESYLSVHMWANYTHPTTLTLSQQGFPDETLTDVVYSNRPFTAPLDFALRYGRIWGPQDEPRRFGGEIELIHYKLYLEEANDPKHLVQRFTVTDGLNFLFANAVVTHKITHDTHLDLRAGLGPIISHPETTVRGQSLGKDGDFRGYHYSGIGGRVGVGIRKEVLERWQLSLEYSFAAGTPNLPIASGTASTPVRIHHLSIGWAYKM